MIPTVPQPGFAKWCYRAYVTVFFVYLALPLTVVCVFAFNNSGVERTTGVMGSEARPELREALADYAHQAWSGWMRYLFSKCINGPDYSMLFDLVRVGFEFLN